MSVSARGDKMDSVLLVRDLIQLSRWLAASDGLCSQPAINVGYSARGATGAPMDYVGIVLSWLEAIFPSRKHPANATRTFEK